jgi:hypothetical protein
VLAVKKIQKESEISQEKEILAQILAQWKLVRKNTAFYLRDWAPELFLGLFSNREIFLHIFNLNVL